MKEVSPDKGLKYTEEEFDQAITDGVARQDAKAHKEEVEQLAEMPLDGDDVLREGDTFVSPDSEMNEDYDEGPGVEDLDPFSPNNVQTVNAITLMRIYDLLGIIATKLDEVTTTATLEKHAEGKLVGPLPLIDM